MIRLKGWLADLMRQTGKTRRELLVLCDAADPFYAGSTPTQHKAAEWFAKMWEQEYDGQSGIHLRRVHYHIDAIGFRKINGMPYTNTTRDWNLLTEASKWARILGLVPADAFDDHRNQDPHPFSWQRQHIVEPTIFSTPWRYDEWFLPQISSCLWSLENPTVSGYDPDDYKDRAYLLEVWIEKSTMDDILVPLTDELGVQFVASSGYQSISNVVKFLKRVDEIGKPARIFYISDHDRAGRAMPIAVSRQIEFWRPKYAPDADVKLYVLALTQEQITEHRLPVSVDKKDSVELDALEALVPGELERIVREAIGPYLDLEINERLRDTKRAAQAMVSREWSRVMAPHLRRLQALNRQVEAVRKRHQKRLEREVARFEKPLARLQSDVAKVASSFRPDLPVRPAQAFNERLDRPGCLFDSSRKYLQQLRYYKSQRGE